MSSSNSSYDIARDLMAHFLPGGAAVAATGTGPTESSAPGASQAARLLELVARHEAASATVAQSLSADVLLVGSTPVLANLWVDQAVAELARMRGPVALTRSYGDAVRIMLHGPGWKGETISAPADLTDLLNERQGRWILQLRDPCEQALLRNIRIRRIILVTGADAFAREMAGQLLSRIAGLRGGEVDVGLVIVGSPRDRAVDAFFDLRRRAAEELPSLTLRLLATPARLEPINCSLACEKSLQGQPYADWLNESLTAAPAIPCDLPPRTAPAPHPTLSAAPASTRRPTSGPARLRPAPAAQARSRFATEATAGFEKTIPEDSGLRLVTLLPGMTAVEVPEIADLGAEVAADAEGGLHVLMIDAGPDPLARLAAACTRLARKSESPTVTPHLFTATPRARLALASDRLRLHLLAEATMKTGSPSGEPVVRKWIQLELN